MMWALPVVVFLVAWFLTGRMRQYALALRLVDVPNQRSSHRVATPRGGGVAIVVTVSVAMIWLWAMGGPAVLPLGILTGGLIVAGVGFVDDHRPLSPEFRLASHFLAAGLAMAGMGGMSLGLVSLVLAVVFIAWMTNLTNFMDGIDGLAGVQTLTVCAAGAALSASTAPAAGNWIESAVMAAAAAGFLVWNWPPARVFMGDGGSGFIGFMIAVLSLRAAAVAPALGWSWIILSGVFIVDATVTLLWRAVRRERLFEAHRSHAYQRLALAWGAHRPVTLLVVAINVCWLTPIAVLVATGYVSGITGVAVAYLPLVIGVLRPAGSAASSRP